MLMTRFGMRFALLALCLTGAVTAAETPLAAIPVQAGVLVRLKKPVATINKAANLVDKLQFDGLEALLPEGVAISSEWIRSSTQMLGQSVGDGVDLDQDWWLFFLSSGLDESPYAYVVPATDTAVLQASVIQKNQTQVKEREDERATEETKDFQSMVYQKWVIYGSKVAVDAASQCLAGEQASIESRLKAEAVSRFDQGDLAVLIDKNWLGTMNADFGESLVEGLPTILSDQFSIEIQSSQSEETWNQIMAPLAKALSQGISDIDFLVTTVGIEGEELHINTHLLVNADSPTAAFFRANPGSEMEALSSLPPCSGLYLGFQGNQKALSSWLTEITRTTMADKDDDLLSEILELRKSFEELNYGLFTMAFPVHPIEQGLFRSLSIFEVDAPQRAREIGLKLSELTEHLTDLPEANKDESKRSTEKYGEYSVDVNRIKPTITIPDLLLGVETDDETTPGIESFLYGPDKSVTRTVYLKDRIVECVGGTKSRTAAAVRRIANASGDDIVPEPHFAKLREKLTKKANVLVMIDTGGIVAATMQAWNSYVDLMVAMEAIQPNEIVANRPQDVQFDEGVPREIQQDNANVDDNAGMNILVAPAESLTPEDVVKLAESMTGMPLMPVWDFFVDATETLESAPMDEAVEMAPNVIQVLEVQAPEGISLNVAQMKFERQEIDSLHATPSLIGFSLALEPQASHLRIVIPVEALQQLLNVGKMMAKNSGITIEEAHLVPEPQEINQTVPVQVIETEDAEDSK